MKKKLGGKKGVASSTIGANRMAGVGVVQALHDFERDLSELKSSFRSAF